MYEFFLPYPPRPTRELTTPELESYIPLSTKDLKDESLYLNLDNIFHEFAQSDALRVFNVLVSELTEAQIGKLLIGWNERGGSFFHTLTWALENHQRLGNSEQKFEVFKGYYERDAVDFIKVLARFHEQPWVETILTDAIKHIGADRYPEFIHEAAALFPAHMQQRLIHEASQHHASRALHLASFDASRSQDRFNSSAFMQDRALELYSSIQFAEQDGEERRSDRRCRMISRNLSFRGASVETLSDNAIKTEDSMIEVFRTVYGDISLTENRRVLLIANDEIRPDGQYRFLPDSLLQALSNSSKQLTVLSPVSVPSVRDLQRCIIDFMTQDEDPVTIIVNAHGSPNEITLSDDMHIGLYVFVEAILKRQEQLAPEKKDILCFTSCNAHTLCRNLDRRMHQIFPNEIFLPIPVLAGMSEYGQLAFSDYDSDYGQKHLEILFKEGGGKISTFFDRQFPESEPFVYIPAPDGLLRQIA